MKEETWGVSVGKRVSGRWRQEGDCNGWARCIMMRFFFFFFFYGCPCQRQ